MARRPVVSTMRPGGGEPDDIDRRVAARIARGRAALQLEPAVLDAVLAFREGTVERLEACQTRAAPSHLLRLADLFGVEIDWFFAEAEEPPAAPAAKFPPGRDASAADPSHGDGGGNGDSNGDGNGAAEARRFLAVYSRLRDASVRARIRAMVEAVANSKTG